MQENRGFDLFCTNGFSFAGLKQVAGTLAAETKKTLHQAPVDKSEWRAAKAAADRKEFEKEAAKVDILRDEGLAVYECGFDPGVKGIDICCGPESLIDASFGNGSAVNHVHVVDDFITFDVHKV